MTSKRIKIIAAALVILPLIAFNALSSDNINAATLVPEDAAATYKAKCAMCHGPAAAKAFDPAKSDDELVQIVLKGKKGEKPPYMPGYEEKGMTADQAKELVTYMKGLRATGD